MVYASKLLAALAAHPDRIALEAPGQRFTYRALSHAVDAMKSNLAGIKMAALMMANSPAWVVTDLACVATNIPLLPLPDFFSDKQVEHALTDAGVDTVITDQPGRFAGTLTRIQIAGQPYYRVALDNTPVALPENTAKITYTSGTTDSPKGVCLSQEAMETVSSSLLEAISVPGEARHLCLLPLAVLLENVAGVYAALLAGGTLCLPHMEHTPQELYKAIDSARATSCILVPELLRMLLAVGKPLPSLTYAAVGGARVAPELLHHARRIGLPVYEGYGLSEAGSVVAVNTPEAQKIGAVGKVLPHIKLRRDETGELLLQHPLFSGYLGDTQAPEEWYATGDIGWVDDEGFLHIEGRRKHMYITSFGRNVSPEWIESLLTAQPAIAQAVVFGEEKPFSTAIIVPRQPQVNEALAQVNQQLPDYARIGAQVVVREPFSVENGQLTGTGRPRRNAIYRCYAEKINACYPEGVL